LIQHSFEGLYFSVVGNMRQIGGFSFLFYLHDYKISLMILLLICRV